MSCVSGACLARGQAPSIIATTVGPRTVLRLRAGTFSEWFNGCCKTASFDRPLASHRAMALASIKAQGDGGQLRWQSPLSTDRFSPLPPIFIITKFVLKVLVLIAIWSIFDRQELGTMLAYLKSI